MTWFSKQRCYSQPIASSQIPLYYAMGCTSLGLLLKFVLIVPVLWLKKRTISLSRLLAFSFLELITSRSASSRVVKSFNWDFDVLLWFYHWLVVALGFFELAESLAMISWLVWNYFLFGHSLHCPNFLTKTDSMLISLPSYSRICNTEKMT
jgi:hypothetical protein